MRDFCLVPGTPGSDCHTGEIIQELKNVSIEQVQSIKVILNLAKSLMMNISSCFPGIDGVMMGRSRGFSLIAFLTILL
ncbi:hypothetical protein HRM2_00750 [Desulforapulum autotrophicum HRM2]|uniref:Uncharacterized protein n=1 Tax=Desulforapulum autotrophicum (strain ATCC 43914 / DSM 3382 / VKM B-1955 / HRM2) TaxID=177437 RepID=C0QE81_DESAH|nr:hypothetical protein HRM2_00750 [Desulforapulum autotrophicum HRM2]